MANASVSDIIGVSFFFIGLVLFIVDGEFGRSGSFVTIAICKREELDACKDSFEPLFDGKF